MLFSTFSHSDWFQANLVLLAWSYEMFLWYNVFIKSPNLQSSLFPVRYLHLQKKYNFNRNTAHKSWKVFVSLLHLMSIRYFLVFRFQRLKNILEVYSKIFLSVIKKFMSLFHILNYVCNVFPDWRYCYLF